MNEYISILYSAFGTILGFTVHEYCHALTAYKLGDTSAKDEGRLTLNPLKHIDWLGFIFVCLAGFGWAKPVQVNTEHLKHPKRDMALIAAAGPFSNLILGITFLGLTKLFVLFFSTAPDKAFQIISTVLLYTGVVNVGLFVFNMLPLPPLDGSHILFAGLNLSKETEAKCMKYGSLLLLILLIIENRIDANILPINMITDKIVSLFFK